MIEQRLMSAAKAVNPEAYSHAGKVGEAEA